MMKRSPGFCSAREYSFHHRFAAVVWGCIISVIALKSLSLIVQVVIQVVVLPYYQLVFSPASNFEDSHLGLA